MNHQALRQGQTQADRKKLPVLGVDRNIGKNQFTGFCFPFLFRFGVTHLFGLFTFSLPGEEFKATWAKAGLGVEGELAGGKASVMLNATTSSSAPNAWLAARYQISF